MSTYRSNILFKDLVMGVLLIYLFYALTNLFVVANSTGSAKLSFLSAISARRQTLNTHHDTFNLILNGEKSIIDEDQINITKSFPAFFVITFNRLSLFKIKTPATITAKATLHNLQHSYLSFCILRI